MYLKRIDGRRVVTLPNGKLMTRADLPPESTTRWVASRKASVVKGIMHGLLTRDEAEKKYGLSPEELDSWLNAVQDHGEAALRVTAIQRFRQL